MDNNDKTVFRKMNAIPELQELERWALCHFVEEPLGYLLHGLDI